MLTQIACKQTAACRRAPGDTEVSCSAEYIPVVTPIAPQPGTDAAACTSIGASPICQCCRDSAPGTLLDQHPCERSSLLQNQQPCNLPPGNCSAARWAAILISSARSRQVSAVFPLQKSEPNPPKHVSNRCLMPSACIFVHPIGCRFPVTRHAATSLRPCGEELVVQIMTMNRKKKHIQQGYELRSKCTCKAVRRSTTPGKTSSPSAARAEFCSKYMIIACWSLGSLAMACTRPS